MRENIEKQCKELLVLKGLESLLRWDIQREEKRQTEEEQREEAMQIMEWREVQQIGMKNFVEEKTKDQRIQELLESKDYQEFKREWKAAMRRQELERIKEELAKHMDEAQWRAELQRLLETERQVLCQENMANMQELREIRQEEHRKEKAQQDDERVLEIQLDIEDQANQVALERAELMKNLHLLRVCQKIPVGSGKALQRPLRA